MMRPQRTAPVTPSSAKRGPADDPLDAAMTRVAVTLADTSSELILTKRVVLLRLERHHAAHGALEPDRVAEQEEEHGEHDDEREQEGEHAPRHAARPGSRRTSRHLAQRSETLAMTSCSSGRNGARAWTHSQTRWNQADRTALVLELPPRA